MIRVYYHRDDRVSTAVPAIVGLHEHRSGSTAFEYTILDLFEIERRPSHPPHSGLLDVTRAHGVAVGVDLGRTVTVFKKL